MEYLLNDLPASLRRVARTGEPLSRHCTWRIGGPADLLVPPATEEDLLALIALADARAVPWILVGAGSNLLFDDEGYRGLVILTRALSSFAIRGGEIRCLAGAPGPRVAWAAAAAGLSGMESLAGIPGTLGGMVAMNAGTNRAIGDIVRDVRFVGADGIPSRWSRQACNFGYRASAFQRLRGAVTEIVLEGIPAAPEAVRRGTLDALGARRQRLPLGIPSCGSVFANAPELTARHGAAGRVMDACGLKGARVGNAVVSDRHANFILNLGHARSSDVLELIRRARNAVHARTGFWLTCEVRYVHPFNGIRPAHEAVQNGADPAAPAPSSSSASSSRSAPLSPASPA